LYEATMMQRLTSRGAFATRRCRSVPLQMTYQSRRQMGGFAETLFAGKTLAALGAGAAALGGYYFFGAGDKYSAVRADIANSLDDFDWDDGSWGPVLVRLGWHASGTFCPRAGNGGSDGATMRFGPEAGDGANAGLDKARAFMDSIKAKYPDISYADLWILASYVAIEEMGGPKIAFRGGRTDAPSGHCCPPNGRLPDAMQGAKHIRDVFGRMGFNDQEMVAIIGGGHAIGRCHTDRSGFKGPWTESPTTFSNQYFKVLFDRTWQPKRVKETGARQFEDKETQGLMMLPSDLALRDDPEFAKWSRIYYDDEPRLFKDFAAAFKKLTELGCKTLE